MSTVEKLPRKGSLAPFQRLWWWLLLVVFHRVGLAHVHDVRVLAGVAAGSALMEETQFTAFEKHVLFIHECVNMGGNFLVFQSILFAVMENSMLVVFCLILD